MSDAFFAALHSWLELYIANFGVGPIYFLFSWVWIYIYPSGSRLAAFNWRGLFLGEGRRDGALGIG